MGQFVLHVCPQELVRDPHYIWSTGEKIQGNWDFIGYNYTLNYGQRPIKQDSSNRGSLISYAINELAHSVPSSLIPTEVEDTGCTAAPGVAQHLAGSSSLRRQFLIHFLNST